MEKQQIVNKVNSYIDKIYPTLWAIKQLKNNPSFDEIKNQINDLREELNNRNIENNYWVTELDLSQLESEISNIKQYSIKERKKISSEIWRKKEIILEINNYTSLWQRKLNNNSNDDEVGYIVKTLLSSIKDKNSIHYIKLQSLKKEFINLYNNGSLKNKVSAKVIINPKKFIYEPSIIKTSQKSITERLIEDPTEIYSYPYNLNNNNWVKNYELNNKISFEEVKIVDEKIVNIQRDKEITIDSIEVEYSDRKTDFEDFQDYLEKFWNWQTISQFMNNNNTIMSFQPDLNKDENIWKIFFWKRVIKYIYKNFYSKIPKNSPFLKNHPIIEARINFIKDTENYSMKKTLNVTKIKKRINNWWNNVVELIEVLNYLEQNSLIKKWKDWNEYATLNIYWELFYNKSKSIRYDEILNRNNFFWEKEWKNEKWTYITKWLREDASNCIKIKNKPKTNHIYIVKQNWLFRQYFYKNNKLVVASYISPWKNPNDYKWQPAINSQKYKDRADELKAKWYSKTKKWTYNLWKLWKKHVSGSINWLKYDNATWKVTWWDMALSQWLYWGVFLHNSFKVNWEWLSHSCIRSDPFSRYWVIKYSNKNTKVIILDS